MKTLLDHIRKKWTGRKIFFSELRIKSSEKSSPEWTFQGFRTLHAMQREGWQSGWWVVCAPRGIQCKKNHTWIFYIPFRIQFLNSNWSQFPWITHKNWKRVRMFTSWLTYFCGNASASKEWLELNNKFIEMEICTLRINLVHLFSKSPPDPTNLEKGSLIPPLLVQFLIKWLVWTREINHDQTVTKISDRVARDWTGFSSGKNSESSNNN